MKLKSPIGDITLLFDGDHLAEVVLPGCRPSETILSETAHSASQIKKAFELYFAAKTPLAVKKAWEDLVAITGVKKAKASTFAGEVRRSLLKVDSGDVISYGELAAESGHPRAARAVGTVMRTNPLPIIVPCHRVLQSSGGLGNYMGGKDKGLKAKKWLLSHEGALS